MTFDIEGEYDEKVFKDLPLFSASEEFPELVLEMKKDQEPIEKILVAYWVFSDEMQKKVGINHNSYFDYSLDKQREIIETLISKGLKVMVYKNDKNLVILVDNKMFRQR
jgi:hypothetical protein